MDIYTIYTQLIFQKAKTSYTVFFFKRSALENDSETLGKKLQLCNESSVYSVVIYIFVISEMMKYIKCSLYA